MEWGLRELVHTHDVAQLGYPPILEAWAGSFNAALLIFTVISDHALSSATEDCMPVMKGLSFCIQRSSFLGLRVNRHCPRGGSGSGIAR